MEIETFGSIGLTVALAALSVEIIKKIIMDKIFPPKESLLSPDERKLLYSIKEDLKSLGTKVDSLPKESPSLLDDERSALFQLRDMHDNKDQDGIPLWWVPRSWNRTLEKLLEVSSNIVANQKDFARTLDNVIIILERIVTKIDKG